MKMHPCLVAMGLVLALAACRPGVAEYTESEAPTQLTLDEARARVDLRFAAGSARLLAADAARLRGLAASGGLAPSDRVTVSVAGPPALANARFNAIAAALLPYRIVVSRGSVFPATDRALIDSGRYLVTLPSCPNWSKDPALDFTNALASNYGCASATNLGRMVWSPADLAEGRPLGLADAIPAAAAVQRYQTDKVTLPTAASIGPIAATSSAPPPAAGGGPTGSTP